MNLHILDGPNFSGRTARLREWVGLPNDTAAEASYSQSAYIGPDAAASFSGIAPTIATEFDLLASDKATAQMAKRAMEALGFGYCLERNPYTLSGGEQVVAAVIAATVSRPKRIAIDCGFEQLSPETRSNVMRYLADLDGDLMIADNRLDEWSNVESKECLKALSSAPVLHTDVVPPLCSKPEMIEVVDLCFDYVQGKHVIKNLNLKLETGKKYLLKGPNGSGKSTLSKILCGLLKPSSGEIRLNGQAIKPWLTPGRYVGYHFQNPDYQLFASTVKTQMDSLNSSAMARYYGFGDKLETHPLDLPYALKKRVAVASTLLRQSNLTILDEPTLGQDAIYVAALLKNLSGIMCLTISHSQSFESLEPITL